MEKAKYVYIHTKEYSDYDGQDAEDIILGVSTDFKKIMDGIDHTKSYYESQIIVAENGDFYNRDIIMFGNSNILQSIKKYIPVVLLDNKKEFDYVYSVLKEWVDKRNSFILEEDKKRNVEAKRKQEEKDKREYERLKKKFESN